MFTGSCGPQNDDHEPASFATALNFSIQKENTDYVLIYSVDGNGGAISSDLNYVSQHCGCYDCDLWEEVEVH